MSKIQAIIFDFDGVFVDSWEFHVWAMHDGCKKLGIETDDDELTRVFFGKTLKEATVDFLRIKNSKIDPEEFVKMKLSYDPLYADQVPAFEKVVDFTKENNNKYRMCIASATRRVLIEPFLKREGLDDAFEFVIDADDVEKGKPDPEVYLKALERLGLDKSEVVIVEDSEKGVQAAKAAGIFVIALLQTTPRDVLMEAGADMILEDAGKLAEAIENASS